MGKSKTSHLLLKSRSFVPPVALLALVVLLWQCFRPSALCQSFVLIGLVIGFAWLVNEVITFAGFYLKLGENHEEHTAEQRYDPDTSTLEMLYKEQWKEYHHTEYMIFVFVAAVSAADVALLQVGRESMQTIASLTIATILGLFSVLVTWRQNGSRHYRMKVITRLEKLLHINGVVGKEHRTAPRLSTTLLVLSILLFLVPLFFLLAAARC